MENIEALHQSLLELSKSGTVHYEVTAAEIAATRFAILKIEGVEINAMEQAEYIAQAKIKQAIEKEVNALVEKRARLHKEISELELERSGLQEENKIESMSGEAYEAAIVGVSDDHPGMD